MRSGPGCAGETLPRLNGPRSSGTDRVASTSLDGFRSAPQAATATAGPLPRFTRTGEYIPMSVRSTSGMCRVFNVQPAGGRVGPRQVPFSREPGWSMAEPFTPLPPYGNLAH